MAHVKQGDTVKVHYTGRLPDGTVFDSSVDRAPLEFTVGEGQIIPGVEDSVVGMRPGEAKTAAILADQAYGPYRDEMALVVDREQLPDHLDLEIDQELQVFREDGQAFIVRITDISEADVTLDANHPLAGKDLTFDIQLVEIVSPIITVG
jgi:FKBP-type peptidyl-prolyl cis-trans isomerase 2